ncbi:hypothetical protein NSQ45_12525 [Caldifermentibacillus hisashii]|uniref:hypothetical protein n=1 Tax=Caldifermentibacillus hisashii TaxID=996558 RepID=UPI0034D3DDA6
MQQIRNQNGYSLLLTIFVFVLFTVLTMTLLTATLTGAKRNQISEDNVQATELATMGIDHLSNKINEELKEVLGEEGLTQSAFNIQLDAILNQYLNKEINVDTGNTGTYKVKVTAVSPVDKYPLKRNVTIESKGIVDGKVKKLTSIVQFGAQSTLETLKYTVGSYISDKCSKNKNRCIPGEGNTFLHGGVSIKGDFKVDGNLITTNRGYAKLGGEEQWISSLYPSALPADGQKYSHIVLGGKIYTFTNKPGYQNHINYLAGGNYTNKTNNITDAFNQGEVPLIVERQPVRDDIKIEEMRSTFTISKNEAVKLDLDNLTNTKDLNYPDKKVYASYKSCERIWWDYVCTQKYDGNYIFYGNNTFGNFQTDGSLTLRNSSSSFKKTVFTNGAYINGNLTVGNNNLHSYDSTKYEKIQLDGPVFVNGDVHIAGVNGEFNTIMYVNGNVTIEYSVINGLNKIGSLIIFARGNIDIRNNSVNQDTPSNIKGFFYSEKELEMFGVGSNIRIEGGISAKRIELNAIRGRASDTKFEGSQEVSNKYFEASSNQVNKTSRLQIIYDPNIMNTYADLKSREPMVISVDPPQITERKLE